MEICINSSPIDYDEAHDLMQDRVKKIRENYATELIWFLEHKPVITLGRSYRGEVSDFIDSIPVKVVGRGGQATYHAPGQRVVYLMVDLRKRKWSVSHYMESLRIWVVSALKRLKLQTYQLREPLGVWVDDNTQGLLKPKKIAAFGVRVSRGVAWHGLSVNVSLDLSPYELFLPCGLKPEEYGVTSLNLVSGKEYSLSELDNSLLNCLETIFPDTNFYERKVI